MPFNRQQYKQRIINLYTGINAITDPNVSNSSVIENVAEELSWAIQDYIGSGFNLIFKDAAKVASTANVNINAPGLLS